MHRWKVQVRAIPILCRGFHVPQGIFASTWGGMVDACNWPAPQLWQKGCTMLDTTSTKFSHVREEDTAFETGGLRDFFLYKDLGIKDATNGKVVASRVCANPACPPEGGTGWHRHEADFHIVIMTKGWARFMYEDQETLVKAGDCVHQRPGVRHFLFDYSPDMEYIEIVSPGDFGSVDVEPVCPVPAATPWA
jgi:mannose-6-phosphate isomerase-like protein (cupin superfamily)